MFLTENIIEVNVNYKPTKEEMDILLEDMDRLGIIDFHIDGNASYENIRKTVDHIEHLMKTSPAIIEFLKENNEDIDNEDSSKNCSQKE